MRTVTMTLLAVLALTLVPACGGGGDTTTEEYVPEGLNQYEALLVGTYELADFKLYSSKEGLSFPRDYETWTGTLTLGADRRASVVFDMCESDTGRVCLYEKDFIWKADYNLLELMCTEAGTPNAIAEWEQLELGVFETHFFVPTNREDCGQFVIDSGYELFHWNRIDAR